MVSSSQNTLGRPETTEFGAVIGGGWDKMIVGITPENADVGFVPMPLFVSIENHSVTGDLSSSPPL